VLGDFITSSPQPKLNIYSKVKNYYKCQIEFRLLKLKLKIAQMLMLLPSAPIMPNLMLAVGFLYLNLNVLKYLSPKPKK
jgi:hypothetical protein